MKKINFILVIIFMLILFFNGLIFAAPEVDIFDNWIVIKNKNPETGDINSVDLYQADYAIPLRIVWKNGEVMIVMKPYKIEDLGNEHKIYYQFDDGVANRVVCRVSQENKSLYIPNHLEKEIIQKMMTHERLSIGNFELPDPTAGTELNYNLNRFDEAVKKYSDYFLND
jgi:hypothetical protein